MASLRIVNNVDNPLERLRGFRSGCQGTVENTTSTRRSGDAYARRASHATSMEYLIVYVHALAIT